MKKNLVLKKSYRERIAFQKLVISVVYEEIYIKRKGCDYIYHFSDKASRTLIKLIAANLDSIEFFYDYCEDINNKGLFELHCCGVFVDYGYVEVVK